MSSTPWGYGPKNFDVPAGSSQLLELRVPSRGELDAVLLAQVEGADGGTFEIFDSREAAERAISEANSSSVDSSSDASVPTAYAAHSITGPLTITAGRYSARGLELAYMNRDGTPTNNVRRLWGVITATGSGTLTFSLSLTIYTD